MYINNKTKLYMQIYDTVTKGVLSNPRKQCHKLVETIFHMYEKMELLSLVNSFKICVCGLNHCKCTGRISNKSGYLKSRYHSHKDR